MIWLNPWAWLGTLGVALPVLIHLLGRGHARAHRFPTLRFLDASRLLPTQRTRIHDALLLIVRCAVIVFAAAALARPLLLTAGRRQTLDRGLARVIVVDTSASMQRATPTGGRALDSARALARSLVAGAPSNIIVESSEPARELSRANTWLLAQGRRGELVVISDFQRGTIDSADFVTMSTGVGIALRRVPVVNNTLGSIANANGMRIAARTTISGDRTDAEWLAVGPAAPSDVVALLGADADRETIAAARIAAATIATPLPLDSARAVAIVFSRFGERSALSSSAKPVDAPWMVDLLARARAESLHVASAGVASVAGRLRLMLFTDAEPGSFTAARLAAAASMATSIAPPPGEIEPESISDAALAAWQRPVLDDVPSQLHPTDDNGPSDGRWLWFVALALLLVELPLRRRHDFAAANGTEERKRAA